MSEKCPNCSSENTRKRGTYSDKAGNVRQTRQCKECGKRFTVGALFTRTNGIRKRERKIKIVRQNSALDVVIVKTPLTVDSIYGIPCFQKCCGSFKECNPESCKLLDTWLGVPETFTFSDIALKNWAIVSSNNSVRNKLVEFKKWERKEFYK